MDLAGLNRHWKEDREDYVVLALLVRIKGESLDCAHLLPCTAVTGSGLDVRKILKRLLEAKENVGFRDGPAVSDVNGKLLKTKDLDDMLHKILFKVYDEKRDLFPVDILDHEMVSKHYQCFRTFRRSSDTRAI